MSLLKKKKPKLITVMNYGSKYDTYDIAEDEVYDLLKVHIDKYKFNESQLSKLEKPTVNPDYKEVMIQMFAMAILILKII